MTHDGLGITGCFLHYGLVIFLVSSAFILFIVLWRCGRLDMGEEAKHQMMQEEEP